jgi:hypothetical protein
LLSPPAVPRLPVSLWLGFHDDLADSKSDDPVLRKSTRLTCMSVFNGQTSYDPRFVRDLFPGTDTYKHQRLAQLFAYNLDVPIKNQSIGIHHPKFGQVLKERMDKLGIECQVHARVSQGGSTELTFGFIKKHFGMK